MRQVSRLLIDRIANLAQAVECDRAAFALTEHLPHTPEALDLYRSTRLLLDAIRELHIAPLSDGCPPTLRTGRRLPKPPPECEGCEDWPCDRVPARER